MFLAARLRSGPITGRKMQRRALACSLRLSVWDLLQTFASHVEPRQRCLRRNIPTEMAGIRFVPSRAWWSLSVGLGSLISTVRSERVRGSQNMQRAVEGLCSRPTLPKNDLRASPHSISVSDAERSNFSPSVYPRETQSSPIPQHLGLDGWRHI